jgi:hypothetical protein
MFMQDARAFTVVLTGMVSVLAVSVLLLATALAPYERAMLRIVRWVTESNRNLAVFLVVAFALPILLLLR